MQVTQQMLDAAKAERPELPIWALHLALIAALADVPEPADMERAYELSARGLGKRIAELEAKLASVRALADEWEALSDRTESPTVLAFAAELRERLGGT